MHLTLAAGCLLSLPIVSSAIRIPLAKPSSDNSTFHSTLSPWERTLSAVAHLETKYDLPRSRANRIEDKRRVGKRAGSGSVELTNVYSDATYIGTVSVGTPAQAVQVILDTGSSDLWISDSGFASASSSSVKTSTTSFSIAYGSGSASGALATDTVALGSFSSSQTFGLVSKTTSGLIFDPIQGIFGLAWKDLARSGAQPWWLANVDQFPDPLFAFYLTRYSGSSKTVAGGECSIGSLNSAHYKGDVNYVSLPSGTPTYWIVPLDSILVGGSRVSLTTNTKVAMDTGTTLIVGPESDVAALYAAIDGAKSVGNGQYIIPCTSSVNVAFTFGGVSYAMTSSDMTRGLYETGSSMCIGAISVSDLGSAPMTWIIGDAFLKNVYTVFRQNPAAIGFALLSDSAGGSPSVASSSGSSSTTLSSSAVASSSSQSQSSSSPSSTSVAASSSAPQSLSSSVQSSSSPSSTQSSSSAGDSSSASSSIVSSSASAGPSASPSSTVPATTTEGTGGIVTQMIPDPTTDASDPLSTATQSSSSTSSGQMEIVRGWRYWVVLSVGVVVGGLMLA